MNLAKLKSIRAPFYKIFLFWKEKYECPICGYYGPFKDKRDRLHAKCPSCGELERARLHALVLRDILKGRELSSLSVLHFAPENYFREFLKKNSKKYVSADLYRSDVDLQCDVQSIPCADGEYDLVFASHVLEYPEDDVRAMKEIYRVLSGGGGVAILTVPLVHSCTVDRTERHPITRMMHEPGLDYFARLESVFSKVEQISSGQFPEKYQLYVYRGAAGKEYEFPLEVSPGKYADIVPVCYKHG